MVFIVLFQTKRPCLIQRRGAEFSLTTIAKHFGAELTVSLPYLWENMVGPLRTAVDDNQGIGTLNSYRWTSVFNHQPQSLSRAGLTSFKARGPNSNTLSPILMGVFGKI